MEIFKKLASEETPEILMNPETHYISITGRSLPENAGKLFEPVLSWLYTYKDFSKNVEELSVDFSLEYINTASSQRLLRILSIFRDMAENGKKIKIAWYYEDGDDDMLNEGKQYEQISKIKFDFIVKTDDL